MLHPPFWIHQSPGQATPKKKNETIEQARTKLPFALTFCTAAHQSSQWSQSLVDCCPRAFNNYHNCHLEKIVGGAQNVNTTTTAYCTFGKTKSFKFVDWSHRLSVEFNPDTDDLLHSTVYRQKVKINREDSLRRRTFCPTTGKEKAENKRRFSNSYSSFSF